MAPNALPTVLIVDSDDAVRASLRAVLECEFDTFATANFDDALTILKEQFVQVLLWNARGPGNPEAFLAEIEEKWPETERIALCHHTAERDGRIAQVLDPDHDAEHVLVAVRGAVRLFQLARDNQRMAVEMHYLSVAGETKLQARRGTMLQTAGFEEVLRAPDSPLVRVVETARQYASFDVPVLIHGEPGTGRRLIARAIHASSLRSDRPFCEVNCAGLSDDLIELEIFGARNGSVPNGQRTKIGLAQKADRGTLYIKNIQLLSCRLQMRLLRLINDGAVQPVGSHESQPTNLRLIASADESLPERIVEGTFSPELFYEIAVSELAIPPLRARPGDIPIIAKSMLYDIATRHSKPVHGFAEATMAFFASYDWPGNLRELENEVTRMLIFAQDRILGPELISRHILQADPMAETGERTADAVMTAEGSLKDRIEHIEARILRETLTRLKWNKSRAAAELGLSRVGLRAKLDRYGVTQPEDTRELEEG